MKKGWEVKTIAQIANHSLGKMLDKNNNKGTLKPYLRNLNVRWFGFDLNDVLKMKFEEHETDRYSAVRGDVLVCEGGYPGRAAIWESDEPIFFQKAIHRVRFHEPERAKWFVYYLYYCDVSGELKSYFSGSGIQHFTGQALSRFSIPLPPLEEQKQIVAILDEAFEGLDRARANVEANLEDSSRLLTSFVDTLLSQDRDKWKIGTVHEMVGAVRTGPFGSLLHKSDYVEGGQPLINPANIINGIIIPDARKSVSAEALDRLSSYLLIEGDIVIGRRGEMGRCAVVDNAQAGSVCGTGCFFIRPRENVVPAFVSCTPGMGMN
ncbi:restriction endonuclease subunit S [Halochromatium glycolicum]|uniref:Type I restriction modification DNA specificity domain-containing protein n=1 Tax=Halochromatium glycolicum TaxID=85075 RepID=A0AAJ0XC07_9GAMM|nr:hypothetical protein [Halochromatium glycolicum]